MALGRNQVDQLLDGGVEEFGGYHYADAEDNEHPLRAGDAEREAGNDDYCRGNQMKAQVLFFPYTGFDALPGIAKTAELFL